MRARAGAGAEARGARVQLSRGTAGAPPGQRQGQTRPLPSSLLPDHGSVQSSSARSAPPSTVHRATSSAWCRVLIGVVLSTAWSSFRDPRCRRGRRVLRELPQLGNRAPGLLCRRIQALPKSVALSVARPTHCQVDPAVRSLAMWRQFVAQVQHRKRQLQARWHERRARRRYLRREKHRRRAERAVRSYAAIAQDCARTTATLFVEGSRAFTQYMAPDLIPQVPEDVSAETTGDGIARAQGQGQAQGQDPRPRPRIGRLGPTGVGTRTWPGQALIPFYRAWENL